MPIIGIVASSITNALWPANSFESIATSTVSTGGVTSVTFSSIPQTHSHLQIRCRAKSTNGGPALTVQYNGDSTVNYRSHYLETNGATVISNMGGTNTYGYAGYPTPGGAASTMFSSTIIDVLDYTDTNKFKTARCLTGYDTNNTVDGYLDAFSHVWLSTSAVNSITLTIQTEAFVVGSTFALYGVKS